MKENYGEDGRSLEDVFQHICSDLREAYLSGVTLEDGSKLHLVPLGVKGDWPFLEARLFDRIMFCNVASRCLNLRFWGLGFIYIYIHQQIELEL